MRKSANDRAFFKNRQSSLPNRVGIHDSFLPSRALMPMTRASARLHRASIPEPPSEIGRGQDAPEIRKRTSPSEMDPELTGADGGCYAVRPLWASDAQLKDTRRTP